MILEQEVLNIKSEKQLYDAAVKWVEAEFQKKGKLQVVVYQNDYYFNSFILYIISFNQWNQISIIFFYFCLNKMFVFIFLKQ